jgi:hypothetical protein
MEPSALFTLGPRDGFMAQPCFAWTAAPSPLEDDEGGGFSKGKTIKKYFLIGNIISYSCLHCRDCALWDVTHSAGFFGCAALSVCI